MSQRIVQQRHDTLPRRTWLADSARLRNVTGEATVTTPRAAVYTPVSHQPPQCAEQLHDGRVSSYSGIAGLIVSKSSRECEYFNL